VVSSFVPGGDGRLLSDSLRCPFSSDGFVVAVSLGPLLPWVVLSPVLSRWIRWRAIKALENVLANMAMVGQAKP
jgi:hypothetical protein